MHSHHLAIMLAGGCLLTHTTTVAFAQSDHEASPAVSSGILEQVTVTARKREESAQDAPISLIVTSGEALVQNSVRTFVDLAQQSPALQITNSH